MIENIGLLHYLSKETYKEICNKLNLDGSDRLNSINNVFYQKKPIYRIHPFSIFYNHLGNIVWFLHVNINFPKYKCNNNEFGEKLYEDYTQIFGNDAVKTFSAFQEINCDYIEFSNTLKVKNANAVIDKMKSQGCSNEQINKNMWDQFENPHAKIGFCISKKNETYIETLIRCYGPALKQRIKDKNLHVKTGVSATEMLKIETEKNILDWCISKYKIIET